MKFTLIYWRNAAFYLKGRRSKAVELIDRFIERYGEEAIPKKTPAEITALIMNIDYAGFGVLDEEIM